MRVFATDGNPPLQAPDFRGFLFFKLPLKLVYFEQVGLLG